MTDQADAMEAAREFLQISPEGTVTITFTGADGSDGSYVADEIAHLLAALIRTRERQAAAPLLEMVQADTNVIHLLEQVLELTEIHQQHREIPPLKEKLEAELDRRHEIWTEVVRRYESEGS